MQMNSLLHGLHGKHLAVVYVVLLLVLAPAPSLAVEDADVSLLQLQSIGNTALCEGPDCGASNQCPGCPDVVSSESSFSSAQSCTPKCLWKCESQACDEVCTPKCEDPKCEVRCSSPDLGECFMDCQNPDCRVTCPERMCPARDCPTCETTCTKPVCKLQCPASQNCRSVCEKPKCSWDCKAPNDCPAPKCQMFCEKAPACSGGLTHESVMPPLENGEVGVQTFVAPVRTDKSKGASTIQVMVRRSEGPQLNSSMAGPSESFVHMPAKW